MASWSYQKELFENEVVMTELNWIKNYLKNKGYSDAFEIKLLPEQEKWVLVPVAYVYGLIEEMVNKSPTWHLSTITGQDTGGFLEVLYHFWLGYGLTICTRLSYTEAMLPSISPIIAGASFYEREISELLGITFRNLQDNSLLFLPNGWNKGWPLRKKTGEPNDQT